MDTLELSKELESLVMDESVRREISDLFTCFEGRHSFKDARIFVFFIRLALSDSLEEYSRIVKELTLYLLGSREISDITAQIDATQRLVSYLQDEILYRKQEADFFSNQASQEE